MNNKPISFPLTVLHDIISQKMVLFITTAVRSSNPTYVIFLFGLFLDREDGWRHVPPKRWLILNGLHCAISQKIDLLIYQLSICFKKNPSAWSLLVSFCDLVVRVSDYRSRGIGFDSRLFQIFWEEAGLERGPLSLVRTTEELLGRNSNGFSQENRD
jgi:hypothetical protein